MKLPIKSLQNDANKFVLYYRKKLKSFTVCVSFLCLVYLAGLSIIFILVDLAIHCRHNGRRDNSLYRGFYMSAHVLLNFLNELRKRDFVKSIVSLFRNEFN